MDNQLQLFENFEGTYNQITAIIEVRKGNAKIVLNNEQLMMCWEIGRCLVDDIMQNEKSE